MSTIISSLWTTLRLESERGARPVPFSFLEAVPLRRLPPFLLLLLNVLEFTYTVTYRQYKNKQKVETRRDISYREYEILKGHKDPNVDTITKTRRCFVWENQYFHLDYYQHPQPGLMLLEAYMPVSDSSNPEGLPPFLTIDREVTSDDEFSMFNLSSKKKTPGHHHGHHGHHGQGHPSHGTSQPEQTNGHQATKPESTKDTN